MDDSNAADSDLVALQQGRFEMIKEMHGALAAGGVTAQVIRASGGGVNT